jgi:hypothetical protein
MRLVDRQTMILYANGDYLLRDAEARCLVGDSVYAEEAEAALKRGERVGLTHRGVIVSYLVPRGGEYVEVDAGEVE